MVLWINNRIEVENQMIKMKILDKKRIQIIEEKIQQLQQTQSRTLIKGTAIYQGYPIGVFLENYKGYDKLETVFLDLHENEQKLILDKSASLLADLYKNGIIPRDIKEDNILVRKNDLDVKLIDLDDIETRYEDQDYLQEYSYIRKDAAEAFEKMNKGAVFNVTVTYLYKLLLDKLLALRQNQDVNYSLITQILKARILFEKSIFPAALDMLDKVKQEAKPLERNEALVIASRQELDYLQYLNMPGISEEELVHKHYLLRKALSNLNNLWKSRCRLTPVGGKKLTPSSK